MEDKYDLTPRQQDYVNASLTEKGLPIDIHVSYKDVPFRDYYSDVRSRSEITDNPAAFATELVSGINAPLSMIAANMECLSASEEFIAAAEREGLLAIPPQMIDIKDRSGILEMVGRIDSALIDDPITITPDKPLSCAKTLMKKYGINSLVVVDAEKRLLGILSRRDWCHEKDDGTSIRELMTPRSQLIYEKIGISLDKAAELLKKHRLEKLPLVTDRVTNRLAGLLTAHGVFYKDSFPHAARDNNGRFLRIGSVGVGPYFTKEHLREVELQLEKGVCMLLIDTARAFSINVKEAVTMVRKHFPKLPLIVGNTCSPEGAKFLFELGADVVKVGIGPGEVCRTRSVGVGIPQVSAVARCSAIARLYKKTVVADGGIKNTGDIIKAFAAGADAVMLGYLLAGTEESSEEVNTKEIRELDGETVRVKEYIGSASRTAQLRRRERGSLERIRSVEGVAKLVPVSGTVSEVINDILGWLASGMSYLGVRTVKEIREKVVFYGRQTGAGVFEGIKKK